MRNIYTSALALVSLLFYSCAHTVDLPSAMYTAASNKHYRMTQGQSSASAQEWQALIEEFQRVIETDAYGEWSDDAQYGIASCWLWLGQSDNRDAITRAVDAFNTLLRNYPNSSYAPEAHYWLGRCYERLENPNRAATHYQTVVSRYFGQEIAERAQLQLGKTYENQRHFGLARAIYEALQKHGKNSQLTAQAKRQIERLEQKLAQKNEPPVRPPGLVQVAQENTDTRPQLSASSLQEQPKSEPIVKPTNETTTAIPSKVTQAETAVVIASGPTVADNDTTSPAVDSRARKTVYNDSSARSTETSAEPTAPAKAISNPSLVQQLGLDVKTIVIDPGHGGKDPGAVRKVGQEKRIVLNVASMLKERLAEKGYRALMTRETDVYIPLKERTKFATKHNADVFVSIHVNSSTNSKASGVETYYLALASDESAKITAMRENVGSGYSVEELDELVGKILKESKSAESRRLAQFIQDALVHSTKAKDRNVHHAPFVVLIGAKVPSVLVEIGFLSNAGEGKKLVTQEYQRQIADAIAEGIEQYIRSIPLAVAQDE
jgi:N-acetylmuramoyl-L-alanine amidase